VVFFGLTASTTRMLFTPAPERRALAPSELRRSELRRSELRRGELRRGEPSAWMVAPMVAGVVVLLILGLHPPAELNGLIARAVTQLGVTR
jgi:hydrogenase-4 component F